MRQVFFSCVVAIALVLVCLALPADAQAPVPSNGYFSGNADGWDLQSGASYTSTVGYTAPGSLYLPQSGNALSSGFYFANNALVKFWARKIGATSVTLKISFYDFNTGLQYAYSNFLDSDFLTDEWVEFGYSFSVGSSAGHLMGLRFQGTGGDVYIDDVRISIAMASAAFPYGVSTPIPIDWANYPTPVPYPTFPAFPTAISNVSNTTNSTTNNNSYGGIESATFNVSGTVQLQMTPFPYGKDTPIPIMVPTPQVTPIAMSQAQNQVALGAPSQFYVNPSSSAGVIPIGGSDTNPSHIGGVQIDRYPIYLCLPDQVQQVFSGVGCLDSELLSVSVLNVAGVSIVGMMSVVTVFIFIFFIIRQLQER